MSDPCPHRLEIVYERKICGHDLGLFNTAFPQLNWDTCPKAWFVFLYPHYGAAVIFTDREELPLPSTVRDRMAALDIVAQRDVDIPGLGKITRHSITHFAGDVEYGLELTNDEYDQLLATLGGEESDA